MLILFNLPLAVQLMIGAIVLSFILPKRLFTGLLCTLFDFVCVGAGDVVRKERISGILFFIISLVVLVFLQVAESHFIHQFKFKFHPSDVTFFVTSAGVVASILFAITYGMNRSIEIERERFERRKEKHFKSMQKEFKKRTGESLGPIGAISAGASTSRSRGYSGHSESAQQRREREDNELADLQDENQETWWRQEAIDRAIDTNRDFERTQQEMDHQFDMHDHHTHDDWH